MVPPRSIAARVEAATRQNGDTILLSGRTKELLTDPGVSLSERPGIALKGKREQVPLHAVEIP